VLAVYTRPDDPRRPPVCLEETSTPVVADTREALPATPGPPARVDDADERTGTANLVMVCAPWAGQRPAKVTERRTAVDFAPLLPAWVETHSSQAEKMVLVMDHRHTQTPASRDDALAPAEARRLRERLDIHAPPKHGRGLPMAETELSVRATQGLARRLPDPTTLPPAVAAWERRRHAAKCRVDWHVTTHEARIKLKRLYPSIQLG
jgi:DDE superfamily endonuclease